jgi:Holliday junction resolvasome RuvABC endonuclease subunit
MKTLALDPAVHTGWAHSDGPSGVWDLSVRKDESSGMRLIRLSAKLDEIANGLGVHLVVFEAARGGMPGRLGALVVSAEIQGCIKFWCERNKVQFRGYSPTEIKKHATGKGNASKEKMVEAAQKKWPELQLTDKEHDRVDALWLLDMAIAEYDSKSE